MAMTSPVPQNPYAQAPQPLSPSDEKLYATLVHVGSIFFGFIPSLVGYLVFKDRGPLIRQHSATALNFQLTALIAIVAGAFLMVTFILFVPGLLLVLAVQVLIYVFCIMAAIAANKGQYYKYPASIEFIK
jgi:uncharacterized protein